MCGIVGYVPRSHSDGTLGSVLRSSLQKLEYRGYDSCGMAVVSGTSTHVQVLKDVGKIADVARVLDFASVEGDAGISHTRWATHGGVTKENAHPHIDCHARIAVVHNGIIENYQELRRELEAAGHAFRSQTDTEVIPHLIEEYIKNGNVFEDGVRSALGRLEGSFALLAVHAGEAKIVAARKDSPLVLGIAEKGVFIASDATPFLSSTRQAVFLEDGDMVVVSAAGYQFIEWRNGKPVTRMPQMLAWKEEDAGKDGFAHFMRKEIDEQPRVIAAAMQQDDAVLTQFAQEIMAAEKVVFTACGTSRHAALVTRYAIEQMVGKRCEVMLASEYPHFAAHEHPGTLVIAVSQSGETADVIEGLKISRARGAKIFCLVNVAGSTIDRMSEQRMYFNCGPEIGVASTKAFACQLVLGYLLAYACAGKIEEGRRNLAVLSGQAMQTLRDNETQCRELARMLAGKEHAYCIARGINFAIALEGALKIKEISYVHAEGMPAGELKHGTMALIERGTPVIVVNPTDATYRQTISNAMETKARGAYVIGVSDAPNEVYDALLKIPSTDALFYPLLSVIPLQLLAYETSLVRNLDPDKPRNLAKSVTVK